MLTEDTPERPQARIAFLATIRTSEPAPAPTTRAPRASCFPNLPFRPPAEAQHYPAHQGGVSPTALPWVTRPIHHGKAERFIRERESSPLDPLTARTSGRNRNREDP